MTPVPIDPTLNIIKDLLEPDDTLSNRTVLSVQKIIELLGFCLHNIYSSFRIGSMSRLKEWIRGEQCSNIIGTEVFSWKESNLPNLTYKIPGTLYAKRQLAYKGFKYLSNDFSHPISDRAPAGYY